MHSVEWRREGSRQVNLESSVQSSGRKIMHICCQWKNVSMQGVSMLQNAAKGKAT